MKKHLLEIFWQFTKIAKSIRKNLINLDELKTPIKQSHQAPLSTLDISGSTDELFTVEDENLSFRPGPSSSYSAEKIKSNKKRHRSQSRSPERNHRIKRAKSSSTSEKSIGNRLIF